VTGVPDSGSLDGGFDADGGTLPDGGQPVDGGSGFILDGGVAVSFGADVLPAVRARDRAYARVCARARGERRGRDPPKIKSERSRDRARGRHWVSRGSRRARSFPGRPWLRV
jgi:hypothetical protein